MVDSFSPNPPEDDLTRSIKKCERYFSLLEKHIRNIYSFDEPSINTYNTNDLSEAAEVESSNNDQRGGELEYSEDILKNNEVLDFETKQRDVAIEILRKHVMAKESEVELLQKELSEKVKRIEYLERKCGAECKCNNQQKTGQRTNSKIESELKRSLKDARKNNKAQKGVISGLQSQVDSLSLELKLANETIIEKDEYINRLHEHVDEIENENERFAKEVIMAQEAAYFLIGVIVNASAKTATGDGYDEEGNSTGDNGDEKEQHQNKQPEPLHQSLQKLQKQQQQQLQQQQQELHQQLQK